MNWYHLLGMASVSKWIVLSIFHPGWDPTWFVVCSSFTFYSFVQQKFIKNILCASILHSGNDEKKEKKKGKGKRKERKYPVPLGTYTLFSPSHILFYLSHSFSPSHPPLCLNCLVPSYCFPIPNVWSLPALHLQDSLHTEFAPECMYSIARRCSVC